MFTFIRRPAAKSSLVFIENSRVYETREYNIMLRAQLLVLMMILAVMFVASAPAPGESDHLHFKIHVPKHYHTHHHTVVKKIFVPVKNEIKYKQIETEEHKYHDDPW